MLTSLMGQVIKKKAYLAVYILLFLLIIILFTSISNDSLAEHNIYSKRDLYDEIMTCFQGIIDVNEFEFSDYIGVPLKSRIDLTCELDGNTYKYGVLANRISPYELVTYYQGIIMAEINNNIVPITIPFGLQIGMNIHDAKKQLRHNNDQVTFDINKQEVCSVIISRDKEYSRQEGVVCNVYTEMILEFEGNVLIRISIIVKPYVDEN